MRFERQTDEQQVLPINDNKKVDVPPKVKFSYISFNVRLCRYYVVRIVPYHYLNCSNQLLTIKTYFMLFKRLSNKTLAKSIVAIFIFFMTLGLFNQVAAQNGKVVWTQVVHMEADQVPSTSNSMGIAIFIVTADMKLTYKILVPKVDDGDMLTNSHIHYGAPGVNGTPFIFLAEGIQNLGKNITMQLTPLQFNELVNGTQQIYINVHTAYYPGGAIRGQIR